MNVEIDITRECNFSCPGCDRLCNLKKTNPRSIMNMEDVKILHNHLKGYKINILAVMGGEPTLNPDFLEICNFLYNNIKYNKFVIRTNYSNPILLDELIKICPDTIIETSNKTKDIKSIMDYKLNNHLNFLFSPTENSSLLYKDTICNVHRYAGYGCCKYNGRVVWSICCASISLLIILNKEDLLCNSLSECIQNKENIENNICKHCMYKCDNPIYIKDNDTISNCFKDGLSKYINS